MNLKNNKKGMDTIVAVMIIFFVIIVVAIIIAKISGGLDAGWAPVANKLSP